MKMIIKFTGVVSRVSNVAAKKDEKSGKDIPERVYVVLSYIGGNINVLNQAKTVPVLEQLIDADVECEVDQLIRFGNISTALFPRNLMNFVPSKAGQAKF